MVGSGALMGIDSYVAIGRETSFKTAVTASADMCFLSAGFKTTKEGKILEEICRNRTYANRIALGKKIEGSLENYYYPTKDALNYIIQNAMGGSVTSATVTAGAAYTHTFSIGNLDAQTYKSLTFNVRKGDATNGKIFEYNGCRVGELSFAAEIDEALKMSTSLVGVDSTVGADRSSLFTTTGDDSPLSFVSGRLSVESSVASLTSSSFWYAQSMEFKLSNSLKSDNDSRRIGSDVLDVLPVGVASLELNATMRYDTTTAYDAMLAGTQFAAEFEFLGATLTGSATRRGIKIRFPKVFIKDSGDPEIGGPDEILSSQVVFDVLRDNSSTTGHACQIIVTNGVAAY
jgi:hypothetical protein